jgi:hypothetical protein
MGMHWTVKRSMNKFMMTHNLSVSQDSDIDIFNCIDSDAKYVGLI